MVKHTQTIRRQQQPANCLNVFDHFAGLPLRGLIITTIYIAGKKMWSTGIVIQN